MQKRTWRAIAASSMAAALSMSCQSQQASVPAASSQPQKVYFDDRELVPPTLADPQTPFAETKKCSGDYHGNLQLSLIVDAQGQPRDAVVTRPVGDDLDDLAVKVVEADRFIPGSLNGEHVAVGRTIAMALHACILTGQDSAGKKTSSLHLRKRPEQKLAPAQAPAVEITLDADSNSPRQLYSSVAAIYKVGGDVSAPKAILMPEANFSEYARKAKIQGTVLLSLTVDAHGLPRDVRVDRALEPSLDQQAAIAVNHYRFRPAMRAGRPVPVRVSVEVRFRLY